MSRNCLAVFALLLATAAIADDKPARPGAKPDALGIRGNWEIESWQEGGVDAAVVAGMRFRITADKLIVQKDKQDAMAMQYTLDESKTPKAMDTTHELDPGKPIEQLAVYSLEGDKLTICLAPAGAARPTKLTSDKGDKFSRFVLKRAKPDAKP
jgi:uncharacterized protein (TIGR03067 family)